MPSRFTRAELRDLILDAGLRVLYRRGLRATARHVPMTEALSELEDTHGVRLSMGSVFGPKRLWLNVTEFQIDLFEAALADHPGAGPNQASIEFMRLLDDQSDRPWVERRQLLRDLCRGLGELTGDVHSPGPDPDWAMWTAIWAVAMNDEAARERLMPTMRSDDDRAIEGIVELAEDALAKLGMRFRAPYTADDFATLLASLNDGITLRSPIAPDRLSGLRRPDDEHEWTLFGIALDAFVSEFVEDAM